MEATIKMKLCEVKVDGETVKDLFEQAAAAFEAFSEKACGLCRCEDIKPVWRVVTQGKKIYEYPEWHCTNPKCRARLTLCQHMEGGTLYAMRRLTPEGKPATGDDAPNGSYGPHNGWTTYKGQPKDGEEGQKGRGR